MAILQEGFTQIKREYIFPIIEEKVLKSQKKDLLNLGIGDVALPLIEPAARAFKDAISQMEKTPIGYPSSHGDQSLRQAIFEKFYKSYGLELTDIFISDGINSDLGNLQELFDASSSFAVCDPSYPVPQDVCLMAGRQKHLTILEGCEESSFLPLPPNYKIDVVYLCTPNNPSGTAFKRDELKAWVDWANFHKSILIVDAAYSDFIESPDVPKSIYEIEGAIFCAIELRSFSKSCGFTGLRCSFSCVPSTLKGLIHENQVSIRPLWAKRMATKSNGVAYPVQKAALACLSDEGMKAALNQVNHYKHMAKTLKAALESAGFKCFGAIDAPYVFIKCPEGFTSWQFFDFLLEKCSLVSVPGSGFGKQGEGFVRLSGFITSQTCLEATKRIEGLLSFI